MTDMSQIQKEIQETIERLASLKKIRQRYDEAVKELKVVQASLDKLHEVMVDELEDLSEIESGGLKPFFYKVLGSKEKQIEKERQEYLAASLKFNEHQKSVEVLQYEVELLHKKLGDTVPLENELRTLKARRENEILKSHPTLAQQLLELANNMDKLYAYKKELNDVDVVGKKCIQSLNDMIHHLKQAKQWGNWDMMGGKSRIAGYNKHSAIDRAKNISVLVKHELINLNKELADVGKEKSHFQLNMDNFASFTDIFFDNLISDWVIQQKIVNASNNTLGVRDRVVLIVNSIENESKKADKTIEELQSRRNEILQK